MPTNEERREVAARLRMLASHMAADEELAHDMLGRFDTYGLMELADLIEPEPERTCKMIPFVEEDGSIFIVNCSECGVAIFARGGKHDCNYCPSCGAKVIE